MKGWAKKSQQKPEGGRHPSALSSVLTYVSDNGTELLKLKTRIESRPVLHLERDGQKEKQKVTVPGKPKCISSLGCSHFILISPREPLERDLLCLVPRIYLF